MDKETMTKSTVTGKPTATAKSTAGRHFWNWADGNPETRELFLYGTIAESSWYDDDVTPAIFREELYAASGPVKIYLNSYGGDCVAASQIYTMLIEYPADVTMVIDGIAASAASVIAMAGTEVLMSPTSCMMVHDPMTVAMGDTSDMEKAISQLEAVKETIIDAYQVKTGLDRKEIARMMSEETWMDCHKAVELGFADGILKREDVPVSSNISPVLFSQRSVDMVLVNKICGPEITAGSKAVESVNNDSTDGCIPVKPLYDRLEGLK